MLISRTPTDYQRRIPTDNSGINRYRRNEPGREDFLSRITQRSGPTERTIPNPLTEIIQVAPTRLLTMRQSTNRRTTGVLQSNAVDTYRRGNEFYEQNRTQIQQTATTLRRTNPLQQQTVSILQGAFSNQSQSGLFSSLSPSRLVQEGIRQYQEMSGPTNTTPGLLSQGAQLYKSAGTMMVNAGGLFREA